MRYCQPLAFVSIYAHTDVSNPHSPTENTINKIPIYYFIIFNSQSGFMRAHMGICVKSEDNLRCQFSVSIGQFFFFCTCLVELRPFGVFLPISLLFIDALELQMPCYCVRLYISSGVQT